MLNVRGSSANCKQKTVSNNVGVKSSTVEPKVVVKIGVVVVRAPPKA